MKFILKNKPIIGICAGFNNILRSIHSMIATKELVKPYAKISSYSKDGLVESFELPNKKFVMGIKWHPELLVEDEYVDRLFKKFIMAT